MEFNGEDDSKGPRKRKTKFPLKGESQEDGEEKKEKTEETVSMIHRNDPADVLVGILTYSGLAASTLIWLTIEHFYTSQWDVKSFK